MTTMNIDEFLDLLEGDLRIFDTMIEKRLVATEQKEGHTVSCRSCPHAAPGCCFQKNMIYLREALPIARYLQRTGRATAEFRAHLLEEGEWMEAGKREAWFHEAHPCAFLQQGACSIYALRPTSCRAYHVVSSPSGCQPGNHDGIAFVDYSPLNNAWLQQTRHAHHALGLPDSEKRILVGALPRMVLIALEALEARDFRRYVKQQVWPTIHQLDGWVEGRNPFGDRLIHIRRKAGWVEGRNPFGDRLIHIRRKARV